MTSTFKKILLRTSLILIFISCAPVFSQVNIGISSFKNEQTTPQKISLIISANLDRSNQFKSSGLGTLGDDTARPNFELLRNQNFEFYLSGSVSRLPDERFEVAFRMWNVIKGQDMGGQSFRVFSGDLRLVSHKISDYVYEKTLGYKSVFASRIAFVTSPSSARNSLWIADADGENRQAALTSPKPIFSPSFSPDGQSLAYVSLESSKPVIFIHSIFTGRRRVVANFEGANLLPAWSPDGKYIAFTSNINNEYKIYVVPSEGGIPKPISVNANESQPCFSPDGKYIYLVRSADINSSQIFRFSILDNSYHRITYSGEYNISPRISPDGNSLAYISKVNDEFKLNILDLKTNKVSIIDKSNANRRPSFSPNGRHLIYSAENKGELFLMHRNLGEERLLTQLPKPLVLGYEPEWGAELSVKSQLQFVNLIDLERWYSEKNINKIQENILKFEYYDKGLFEQLNLPASVQQLVTNALGQDLKLTQKRLDGEVGKFISENKSLNWSERISKAISTILRTWLEADSTIGPEIPMPIFPPALKLSQEKWESNKEFEDRVATSRNDRLKEIERIQAEYKSNVEMRNADIQRIAFQWAEKEKQLPGRKKEIINQALKLIDFKIQPKTAYFNPDLGILYVDASIDGGKVERYAYKTAPIQVRRDAITSVATLKMTPEFFITDSGEFGIKAINIESGGVKVAGAPTQADASSQTLRFATIDVPVASMSAMTQQSAMTVDRNQVEQILYRDENDSLRKRLEEQRKAQELALAEETKKAAAESTRLKAESDALRQRQRELELQLASTSRTPINYGRTLNAHALVIGNSAYSGSSKLPNPIKDARSMAIKLRSLGFAVTEALDTDRSKLVNALSQFSRTAVNADITLLFYAGHGVQITGTNYMLPIDLNLNDLAQAPLQGISLNDVVEKYLPGKTKLVFLDACRDNSLMQVASRSVSRGLAPINVSEGTLISYATKDGSVAQDGDGNNSPFTSALLEHLGDPDDIAVVLRKVRDKVMKSTGGKQQPWEYGSLTGGALVLSAIKPK